MIKHGMHLKDRINLYTACQPYDTLEYDPLTPEDWDELTYLLQLLKLFKNLTRRLQGRAPDANRGSI